MGHWQMKKWSSEKQRAELERAENEAIRQRQRPARKRFSMAVLCVFVAFEIRYWLTPVLGEELPFLLFVAAALIAAWYGGAVTGVVALLLGLFLAEDFFVAPKGIPYPVEFFDFIRYIFTASLGVVLIEVLRRGKRRTEIALDELRVEVARRERTESELREAQTRLNEHAGQLEQRVRERTAELDATVESLRGLLYHIAHNLRAPLRAMEGYATLLTRECSQLEPAARDYADQISGAAKRMDELIQDLLEYGNLGHLELELAEVRLKEAAEEALAELARQIELKKADVKIAAPLPEVQANPKLLRRVLTALLDNALKFVSPDVAPRIRIWAERRDAVVRLWIKDNGIGVEPKYQERIFGVFERLHRSDIYEGTGIGLAIVKQGMQRMGGEAGVESRLGEGSRFWIEFRAAPAESPRIEPSTSKEVSTARLEFSGA